MSRSLGDVRETVRRAVIVAIPVVIVVLVLLGSYGAALTLAGTTLVVVATLLDRPDRPLRRVAAIAVLAAGFLAWVVARFFVA